MRVHDAVTTSLGRREFIAPKANKALRRVGPGVITAIAPKDTYVLVMVLHEGATQPAVYLPEELQPNPDVHWKVTYKLPDGLYFKELPLFDAVRDFEDELHAVDGRVLKIEGPFFGAKVLTEGSLPSLSLYTRLRRQGV